MSSTPGAAVPPTPNVAQIPLPPGMTLEQFQDLQGSLVSLAIVTAVAFGVLIWDYFNLLPDEIKMYQSHNKKLWRTTATWAFVVLRYSGIVATLPSLFFTSVQSDHCQAAVIISQVGVILVVASSGIIFCCRLFAIWRGHKVIHAVVGVAYVGMLGCWIAVAAQYRAVNGPPTPFGSNCQIKPIVSWAPISFSSSVAFDALILLLTLMKLNASRAATSKVGYLIYRDSLMYFFFTAVTNTTLLIIEAQGPASNFVKATSMPFSTLITATMGARVFLNLKLFNQREERANQGLPSASSTGSRSAGDRNRAIGIPTPPSAVQPAVPMHAFPKPIPPGRNSDNSEQDYMAYDTSKHPTSFELEHFTVERNILQH